MEFSLFVWLYLSFTVGFIFVLLFGQNPAFRGTPVRWVHWILTEGVFDAIEWFVTTCCSKRGQDCFVKTMECCFDSAHPLLQVSYLIFVAVGYYLFYTNLFTFLPNPWVTELHKYMATASVVLCLLTFVLACRSDPGTVTEKNAELHNSLYPCDGLLWSEKECRTCQLMRPARSKHCSICKRCVARHDHHCGWINNCVGLANLRLFLFFLAVNFLMCLYGTILSAAIIGGELQRRGLLDQKIMDWNRGEAAYLHKTPMLLLKYLLHLFPIPSALFLFMSMSSLLMLAFLTYHAYLMAKGRTQYESYRILDYQNFMLEQTASRNCSEPGGGCWGWLKARFTPTPKVVLPPNAFNRGFWNNLQEVLFWESNLATLESRLRFQGVDGASSGGDDVSGEGVGGAPPGCDDVSGEGVGGAPPGYDAAGGGQPGRGVLRDGGGQPGRGVLRDGGGQANGRAKRKANKRGDKAATSWDAKRE